MISVNSRTIHYDVKVLEFHYRYFNQKKMVKLCQRFGLDHMAVFTVRLIYCKSLNDHLGSTKIFSGRGKNF